MAFKMKGFNPGEGTGLNTRKINKAKRLTKKHVEHTTVDSPTYGTKKSNRKFPRSEKKMNKAVDLLRNQGYSEEEIEQFTGATGYKDAMDWATEPMVKSPMKKNGDFKKTKKKILSSTDIPTKEEPQGIPSEYTGRDDLATDVYRKRGKKYVKELDLEGNPTGKFQQITRKGKRKLKKEGSYVSGRKYKKIKDDYISGKLQEKNVNKRRLKEVKSSIKDLKKERVKKIGNKRAQTNLKSAVAGLKQKKKELKNK